MDYQKFKEILHERRSVRNFTDQEVSVEIIEELIDCARYAPSDTNSQTWEFVAILNQDMIKEISDITWTQLHRLADDSKSKGLERPARLLVRSFGPYATAFSNAPALIVCLATPYESKFRDRIFDPLGFVDDHIWDEEGIKSSCLAIQNFMLAAHAMGLGTCPMTGPVIAAQEQLRAYLNIEPSKQINMVIALGYPNEKPGKLPRKDVSEILKIMN